MNKTLVAFTLLIATSFAAITTNVDLSSTLSSSVGIQMYGTTNDYVGNSISNAGDYNKDGMEDFVIGTSNGKAYLVFGTSSARTAALDLSSASNAATSVRKYTFSSTNSLITSTAAIVVGAAGDMDKDGYDDIAFGIPTWKGTGAVADSGIVVVYYGQKNADITTTSVAIDVDTGAGASQTKYFLIKDAAVVGSLTHNLVGTSLASAGNINRDANGVDDLLIGGPSASGDGIVYIIYGSTTKRTTDVSLNGLSTDGVAITPVASSNALLGTYVAGVGDINGDTYPDAVIGAPGNPGAWIIYGQTSLASGALTTTGTSSNMLYNYLTGAASTQFGQNVGACGDINNDGANDFFVGAPKAGTSNTQGIVYIFTGLKTGAQIADVASLASTTSITGTAAGAYLGWRSDGGIDINNDGVDDLITCAPFIDLSAASPSYSTEVGKCYVMYGKSSFPSVTLASTTLSSSTSPAGFTITGVAGKAFGFDVSVVGTTYTSGGDNFIISSPQATGNSIASAGNVYLFYGVAPTTPTGSGFRLGASLLVFISFVAALMF